MIDVEEIVNEVYDLLGPGFSERVYHNAMEVILRERNIPYESERIVLIKFKGHVIGNLRIDMVIDNSFIIEFKTIKTLHESAEIQGYNYLRLTGLEKAYLVNFPPHFGRQVQVNCISSKLAEERRARSIDM
jgi:GxxExxY protein